MQEPVEVLAVDDSLPALEAIRAIVEPLGADLATATSGEAALRHLLHEPDIAAIVLDIGLPRMDGYEVARRLRSRPEFDDTLLVALTGYGTEEDRRRSAEAGFDEHVTKPPSVESLRSLLAPPKLPP